MPRKNEWEARFGAARRAKDRAYCAAAERAIAGQDGPERANVGQGGPMLTDAGAKLTDTGAKLTDTV